MFQNKHSRTPTVHASRLILLPMRVALAADVFPLACAVLEALDVAPVACPAAAVALIITVPLAAAPVPVAPLPMASVLSPGNEVGTEMTGILDGDVTAGNVLVVTQLEPAAVGHASLRTSCLSHGPVGPVTHSQVAFRLRKLTWRGSLSGYC
jgi:hypothetical protein